MTTYIKLEDVQNILHQMDGTPLSISQATDDINSLPTIDPEKIIEEMIEKENSDWKSIYNEKELILLFAILQKFKS
mgnify:FL=1